MKAQLCWSIQHVHHHQISTKETLGSGVYLLSLFQRSRSSPMDDAKKASLPSSEDLGCFCAPPPRAKVTKYSPFRDQSFHVKDKAIMPGQPWN
jgi:hypothetical protein